MTVESNISGNEETAYQSFLPDEVEGGAPSREGRHHRSSSQALDRLNTKIACTKESIRKEQTARDGKLQSYLTRHGDGSYCYVFHLIWHRQRQ